MTDDLFAAKLTENSMHRDIAILSMYYRMKLDGFSGGFDLRKSLDALAALDFEWSK